MKRAALLCLAAVMLLGGAGCQTVVYPPGAPEIISGFRSNTGVDGGRRRSPHEGIDIKGHVGQDILAAADGWVLDAEVDQCWGPTIVVDHGRDSEGRPIVALYGHVGEMLVAGGDRVERGQVIARIGGNHNEFKCIWGVPHLHFQIGREHRRHGRGDRWGWGRYLTYGERSVDPNIHWADGPYRVTCFEAGRTYRRGTLTYPVPCG